MIYDDQSWIGQQSYYCQVSVAAAAEHEDGGEEDEKVGDDDRVSHHQLVLQSLHAPAVV